jgi:hypothetical protein
VNANDQVSSTLQVNLLYEFTQRERLPVPALHTSLCERKDKGHCPLAGQVVKGIERRKLVDANCNLKGAQASRNTVIYRFSYTPKGD